MKKPNLFLHIGTGKTGTTAIQTFCKINNEKLNEKGVHYFNHCLWTDNSHHKLGFVLWGKEIFDISELTNVTPKTILNELEEEIKNTSSSMQNYIISSELLLKLPPEIEKIEPFKNFILNNFSNVTVICYLRRQDDFIQSDYLQKVKDNLIKPYEVSPTKFAKEFQDGDYFQQLEEWSNLLGRENIKVRVYEKEQWRDQSIFSDFLEILNLNFDDNYSIPDKDISNLSLNAETLEILKIYNEIDYQKLSEIGFHPYKTDMKKFNFLSPTERILILKKYELINQKIARNYLNRKNGVLFYEPVPNEETDRQFELTSHQLVPVVMSIFLNQYNRQLELEVIQKKHKQEIEDSKINNELIYKSINEVLWAQNEKNKTIDYISTQLVNQNSDLLNTINSKQLAIDTLDQQKKDLENERNELKEMVNSTSQNIKSQQDTFNTKINELNYEMQALKEYAAKTEKENEINTNKLKHIIYQIKNENNYLKEQIEYYENAYERKNFLQISWNRIFKTNKRP